MPTYVYKCDECDIEFDVVHSINDEPRAECPRCSKETRHRLIAGGTQFVLVGGGWASDGYSSPTGDTR